MTITEADQLLSDLSIAYPHSDVFISDISNGQHSVTIITKLTIRKGDFQQIVKDYDFYVGPVMTNHILINVW